MEASRAAAAELPTRDVLPLVYGELRELARCVLGRQRASHTLQPTALVHEAYLRLAGQRRSRWESRSHFFAAAATMIRRILVNYEQGRRTLKRSAVPRDSGGPGGSEPTVTEPTLDFLVLDEALRQLGELDPRQARVVELRFFGGLTVQETARVLGVSPRTVVGEWALARAWLQSTLSREAG